MEQAYNHGMDEIFVAKGGIDKAALKALSARSDAKGLLQLGSHLAALGLSASAVLLAEGLWLVPALLLHGLLMTFLFAPLHETIHRTAFRSRWLNDAVAWICGAVLVLPPEYFRAFHFAHHRHTQDPLRDPELAVPKPTSLGAYLWLLTGLPYWRERISTTLLHASGVAAANFIPARLAPKIVREARLLWSLYLGLFVVSVVTGSALVFWLWVLPMLLGQPALRAYLMAEHTGCPLVPDMLRNSRTTRSNALMRRLAWNMPFHVEHHAYPALPFHALPAAHQHIAPMIAVQAPGYLSFHAEMIRRISGGRQAGPRPSSSSG